MVCEGTGLWGRDIWHLVQRDQRLGLRGHLADIDYHPDWHNSSTAKNDPPTVKRMTGVSANRFLNIVHLA